ncbi:MAG: Gfo/Idh/MocA family oxidoreductase [Actinomycetota bacterium]|nr:Gfo/Idh/MocA family oxidoreductase [Actinomycetota bacterium]
MNIEPVNVAIVGCGHIAAGYAEDLRRYPGLVLLGVTDLDPARSRALAADFGCRSYRDSDALLADPEVAVVVNLTSHRAHVRVTRSALEAGKHVFSEKPMALRTAEARSLNTVATAGNLRLGAAPIVLLGELAQTAWRMVRNGRLGTVRLAYAEVNWGRMERWHAAPQPFYDAGPLFDVGVYPLTLLTGIIGPAVRVTASATTLLKQRWTRDGQRFSVESPDFVVAVVELVDGTLVRLTTNFYVADPARQRGVELHGDEGSLWLSTWFAFGGRLEHSPLGEPYRDVPLIRTPQVTLPWAAGVEELARVAVEGGAHLTSGAHAAHVVEIVEAALHSARSGTPVEVQSRFPRPQPLSWAA